MKRPGPGLNTGQSYENTREILLAPKFLLNVRRIRKIFGTGFSKKPDPRDQENDKPRSFSSPWARFSFA
jgi:hypothetical protein